MKDKMRRKNGFTLFELLVSISIIGILTALATISFSAAQKRGRDARRVEDMRAIQTAAEQYYSMNNSLYPAAGMYDPGDSWTIGTVTILSSLPRDPLDSGNNIYSCSDGGGSSSAGYCCCAYVEVSGTGNAQAPCDFAGVTKNYYCVKSQQ